MSGLNWVTLESNPDVMTNCLHSLGLSSEFKIVDVYGFTEELIDMIPGPAFAIIFLYPISKVSLAPDDTPPIDPKSGVYFLKQTISNACGTIALIHAVANSADRLKFKKDSPIEEFLIKTANMTPEERGLEVEKSRSIADVHEQQAAHGQTAPPDPDCQTDFHFVAFVEKNGRLYELDGRKSGPIDHGPSSPETFHRDVGAFCQKIISQTDEPNFSALALVQE